MADEITFNVDLNLNRKYYSLVDVPSSDEIMEDEESLKWSEVIYIESEKRLIYTGHGCSRIPPLFTEIFARNLLRMDLSDNKLSGLEGLNKFRDLEELILDANDLDDSFLLPHMPNLRTLSLNKNRIRNLELTVTKLSRSTPSLRHLSLLGNLACPDQLSDPNSDLEDYHRYRCYVLHHLPNLLFLDSRAVSNVEAEEARIRGDFMRVRRPQPKSENKEEKNNGRIRWLSSQYTPLPNTSQTKTQIGGKVHTRSILSNTLERIQKATDLLRTVICSSNNKKDFID